MRLQTSFIWEIVTMNMTMNVHAFSIEGTYMVILSFVMCAL